MEEDFFYRLGLPFQFNLSKEQLEKHYQKCQYQVHPDRFQCAILSRQASELSMKINEAYRALQNPFVRARVLLKKAGHWPISPIPEIFEQALKWHEKIVAREKGIEKRLREKYQQTYFQLSDAFKNKKFIQAQRFYETLLCINKLISELGTTKL